MKIAYLLNYPIEREDGVTLKIRTQMSQWKKSGHEVKAFNMFEVVENPKVDASQYYCGNWFQKKLKLSNDLIQDMKTFAPDILYFRFTYWNRTLGKLQKNYRNIIEINSDDVSEVKLNFITIPTLKRAGIVILDHFLRKPVLLNTNGLVCVTNELAAKQSFSRFNKQTAVCPNSYDCSGESFRKNIAPKGSRTALFFIGSPGQAWHGVDHILTMAAELKQYDFHVVGETGNDTENMFFHGYLEREEYLKIMLECSICIGTLALYRKKLEEASPLKVREYIACGYPVIIGYRDTAFEDSPGLPEWIHYQDFSHNVNTAEITDFVEKMKDYIVEEREGAQFIDSRIIENKRVIFFEEILF
ncbi:MAG: hypothetical protein JEZ04_10690 [Spirochaetales bacterium]|nr:hypothetical protein [Spirochaetales bacterium]